MAGLFYVAFSVALCIAIYRKLHTVLRRLTGLLENGAAIF